MLESPPSHTHVSSISYGVDFAKFLPDGSLSCVASPENKFSAERFDDEAVETENPSVNRRRIFV